MRDQEERLAVLLVELAQERQDLGGPRRVEVAGGLVGQDQGWAVDERPRDRDALLLAAGELARPVVGTLGEAARGWATLLREPAGCRPLGCEPDVWLASNRLICDDSYVSLTRRV